MFSRINYLFIAFLLILSCEGPLFEIPPEPDTTAPLVEITNPADQGVLSDSVLVTIYASDNDAVNLVQLYINDSLVLDSAESPYQYSWNTKEYEEDEYHNLRARAVDFAGNDNQTSPIRVLIDNQDNVKPNGSLLYPFSGQTLNGLVNIIADASDDDSLHSVVFYINGDSVSVSNSAPFIYNWDTTLEFDDYYYVISLQVNDASGNYITLGPISVLVDNDENILVDTTPPTGAIVYPPMAAIVSGIITIQIDAFDNEKVEQVEVVIDGTNPLVDSNSPYEFTWNTNEAEEDINHFIAAIVKDTSGNTTNLMPVTVFVDNEINIVTDITPPSVVITSPAANQIVSGDITVTVAAFDNMSIEKVDFFLDGVFYQSDTNFPYEVYWNTIQLNVFEGNHTWYAKAFDTSGLINQSESIVINVDNVDEVQPTGYIAQPYAGQVVNGDVEILIYASDDIGVSSVSIFINGENDSTFVNETSIPTAPYSYIWDTLDESINEDSQYFISARINDSSGNFFNVSPIAVVINNDTEYVDLVSPVISIQSPVSGTTVGDSTEIIIFANDNIGIQNVLVTVDDTLEFTLTDSPYVALWNTFTYPNNSYHTISAIAKDSSNNQTLAQPIFVTVDNYYNETVSFVNTQQYVDSIRIDWDSPYNANQFYIIKDGDSIATTTDTYYIDQNVIPGQVYCYQIAAVNEQFVSGPLSDQSCNKALVGPPENFTGTVNQDSIQLNWSNVNESDQYRIYRDGDIINTGTELSFLDTELNYSTSYSYSISSLDNIGDEGPQSNPLLLTTHAELNAPALSIEADSTSFILNWSSVTNAVVYKVYIDELPNSIETSNTTYTYSSTADEENCFKIRAVNEHGTIGPASNQECLTGN
ncbi:MAG: Ig-like domain-containing protein [Candidatus Neomarinimicrobiota bacterium]